jgi:hypothetical protein
MKKFLKTAIVLLAIFALAAVVLIACDGGGDGSSIFSII